MLINEVIVDSRNENPSPTKKKRVIRVRKQRVVRKQTPEKEKEGQKENQTENTTKSEKQEEKRIDLPFPKTNGVRFLEDEEVNKISPQILKKFSEKDLITSTIHRKKIRKANGTRVYFTYTSTTSSKSYIAKAKFESSSLIPICVGEEIHLSAPEFDAKLNSSNSQSSFTLIANDDVPILTIQFSLARTIFDGARRMSLFIFPNDEQDNKIPLPLDLSSKNTTAMPQFGSLYRMTSVKNAFLGPISDDICLISIRKTEKDELKIDSVLDLSDLQIFAIAIASFLGKTPHE